jgi:hypothetical protein
MSRASSISSAAVADQPRRGGLQRRGAAAENVDHLERACLARQAAQVAALHQPIDKAAHPRLRARAERQHDLAVGRRRARVRRHVAAHEGKQLGLAAASASDAPDEKCGGEFDQERVRDAEGVRDSHAALRSLAFKWIGGGPK